MIYNVQILVDVDPSYNRIPADENKEYLTELIVDLLYELDDVEVLAVAIDERKDNE